MSDGRRGLMGRRQRGFIGDMGCEGVCDALELAAGACDADGATLADAVGIGSVCGLALRAGGAPLGVVSNSRRRAPRHITIAAAITATAAARMATATTERAVRGGSGSASAWLVS